MGADIAAVTYLPFCFKDIVTHLESGTSTAPHILMSLVMMYAAVAILTKTCAFVQDLLFFPVINTTIRDLNLRLADHIHGMSLHDYHQLSPSEVISFQKRMGVAVRFFMRACLVSVMPTLLKGIFALSIVWSFGFFRIGLVAGFLLMGFLFVYAMQWYLSMRRRSWVITDKVTLALGDSILNTKHARFYKTFEKERLKKLVFQEASSWFSMTMRMDIVQVLLGLVMGSILACLIGFGAFQVMHKTMSLGDLILIQGQAAALLIPIRQMLMDMRQIFEASVDLESMIKIIQKPFEHRPLSDHSSKPSPHHVVDILNMTFAYPGKAPVFHGFSLQIPDACEDERQDETVTHLKHQTILLAGPSGVGKSTLFALMSGLLKPDTGSIHILGLDVWREGPEAMSTHIHLIPQDLCLFNGTLYDNLTYGLSHVTQEDINQTIQDVGLMWLIARLPLGIMTPVGSMGAHLSGGERQRVAFARALLHKPKILLFDETTNALDTESEAHIMHVMQRHIPVIIMISHGTNLPFHVDQVIRLGF